MSHNNVEVILPEEVEILFGVGGGLGRVGARTHRDGAAQIQDPPQADDSADLRESERESE